MPFLDYDTANKAAPKKSYDFPKLSLKDGEKARVLLIEKSPVFEYVHKLEAPKIVDGRPQTYQGTRKNGTTYTDYSKDFISNAICTGDIAIVQADGSDPKHCTMCALAEKSGGEMVQPPKRRFATHVIRYKTKTDTFNPLANFSVELLVWAFTDQVYNQLADFKETWGDLRKHDLLLGPCKNAPYQQFDINVAPDAAWLKKEEDKQTTLSVFQESKLEDITIAIGSLKEPRWLAQDLDSIKQKWSQVKADDTTDLDEDLGALDDSGDKPAPAKRATRAAAKPKEEAPAAAVDPDDDLAGLGDDEPAAGSEAAVAADIDDDLGDLDAIDDAPAAKAPKSSGEPTDEPPADVATGDDEDDLDALLG